LANTSSLLVFARLNSYGWLRTDGITTKENDLGGSKGDIRQKRSYW